jgi:hypothetical protein
MFLAVVDPAGQFDLQLLPSILKIEYTIEAHISCVEIKYGR